MSTTQLGDAERGIPDQYPVSVTLPVVHTVPSVSAVHTLSTLPAPEIHSHNPKSLEKASMRPSQNTAKIPLSIPSKKPAKKRAGRRVRLQLWFNTYRCVFEDSSVK